LGKREVQRASKRRIHGLEEVVTDPILTKYIAGGTYKKVYRGTAKIDDVKTTVAIAVILPGQKAQAFAEGETEKLLKEVDIQKLVASKKVGSANCRDFVPTVYGHLKAQTQIKGKDYEIIEIVMELMGPDLNTKDGFNLPNLGIALGLAFQTAVGVLCTHKAGYVHKDVKPLNFMQSRDGKQIKITDFGMSCQFEPMVGEDVLPEAAEVCLDHEVFMETVYQYWVTGERPRDAGYKFDSYGLGRSWYEMGLHNVDQSKKGKVDLYSLVGTMLQPDYEDRFTIAEALNYMGQIAVKEHRKSGLFTVRVERETQITKWQDFFALRVDPMPGIRYLMSDQREVTKMKLIYPE